MDTGVLPDAVRRKGEGMKERWHCMGVDVFFTSDLHIGHAKVAETRVEAMNRLLPAEAWTAIEHDFFLAEAWDDAVRPGDIVWVLGDISAGGKAAQLNALEWIKERNGTKHLIAGNHDGCHPMHRDSHKWLKPYLEAFESVQLAARRYIPTSEGKREVLLSHFPYEGDHTDIDRHRQWRLRDEGVPILHGHTHSIEKVSHTRRMNNGGLWPTDQIHVGVDAWALEPVSLERIGELL